MIDDTISRAAAIDAINKALDRETLLNSFVRKVAVDAVKAMPSAQPSATDTNVATTDTISRQAAIKAVHNYWMAEGYKLPRKMVGEYEVLDGDDKSQLRHNKMICEAIKALPSVQPVEDARAMCGECDAWNKYKNYPQPEQFNPCTVCQEFDCSGCKFRRT